MAFGFVTQERHRWQIAFQVADVKRPLLAVSAPARAGNDAIFGASGGTIVNRKSGRKTSFAKRDGIYALEILVAPAARLPQSAADGGGSGAGCARQGPAAGNHP